MKYYCGNEVCTQKINGTNSCSLNEEEKEAVCPYVTRKNANIDTNIDVSKEDRE